MKPKLLFYCQHSLGMGHLIRSLTLARSLSRDFQVIFLNGGPVPDGIAFPDNIERHDLPALTMNSRWELVKHDPGLTLEHVKRLRRDAIASIQAASKPEVIFIELFPFGRKKFAFELLPLLRAARASRPRPLVAGSVRDILVDRGGAKQQRHDDRARWIVERYYDAVLVHADPRFTRLTASFRPARPLYKPVFHTGYVVADELRGESRDATTIPDPGLLVSAGGGSVGGPLFRHLLDAVPSIRRQHDIPITLVAGPFLPEEEWRELQHRSRLLTGVRVLRSVPDLRALLANATASISQCGYNTAMDVLRAGLPALFLPYATGNENEQTCRAQALAIRGAALLLQDSDPSPAVLAHQVNRLLDFTPRSAGLALDGAATTNRILLQLLADKQGRNTHEHVA
ncbi:MAG TPA: hypothetical protein ENJ21_06070 [Chromatiaceae bacterium]|nr:hypothetical protein [Chromatiaceae bacterium]